MAQPNPEANGNAWFVDSLKVVESDNASILALNDIDTEVTAIVTNDFAENLDRTEYQKDSLAYINLIDYKMNALGYESQSKYDGFAVFSEVYYPKGWNAYIDGNSVEDIRVNYTLRGLLIPKGNHKIEFKFEPQVIKTGSRISIAGHIIFILIMSFGVFKYFKPRTSK
jgi:uncharacterized membrane protein YfhO